MAQIATTAHMLETLLAVPRSYLIAAVAAVALPLFLWLRRRPWRGGQTRYPIVLCCGILGFERLGVGPASKEYFNGVSKHLEALGNTIYRPVVPRVGTIEQRATALAEAIRMIPAARVNLIAHSMGGLDARYALSKLGVASRVRSLTTIGTPHRGTRNADMGQAILGALFGHKRAGPIKDLTSASMEDFNETVTNVRGVRYGSVIATIEKRHVHPFLRLTHRILRSSGASDGMVSAASQRWGRVLMRIDADHWGEIGWSKSCNAPQLYEKLARKLRASGG